MPTVRQTVRAAVALLALVALPLTVLAQPAPRTFESAEMPAFLGPPALRERLPADALAYLRLPSPWALIGAPKGGRMDGALETASYANALSRVRAALIEVLLAEVPDAEARETLDLGLARLTSPVEAVVLAPGDAGPPLPSAVLAARVEFDGVADFDDWLRRFTASVAQLELLEPTSPAGRAVLGVDGHPLPLHFDASGKRLYLLLSAAPSAASLDASLQAMAPNVEHPMLSMESRFDTSGQGLFAWVDPAAAISLYTALAGPREAAPLLQAGLDNASALGLGLGTAGGQHRLRVEVEMPRVGFRSFLPVVQPLGELGVAGEPDVVVQLSLPTREDFGMLEFLALNTAEPEDRDRYNEFKAMFANAVGMPLPGLLDVFGQQVVLVSDAAGTWLGVRIGDSSGFEALRGRLAGVQGIEMESREVAGRTMHRLGLPGVGDWGPLIDPGALDPMADMPALMQRYLRLTTNLYWTRDGDYLVMAETPQVLMEREYAGQRTALGDWLREAQATTGDSMLTQLSARFEDLSPLLYRYNLLLLAALGDYADADVDLFAMPSPSEIGLDRDSRYSLGLASSDTGLVLEIGYDYTLLDPVFAMYSSYGMLAGVGMLGAVAVPAYQDYTVRAKVAEGAALSEPHRVALNRFHAGNGRLPTTDTEIADLGLRSPREYAGAYVRSVHVEPGSGEIVITYDRIGTAVSAGAELRYRAVDQGLQGLDWQAHSTTIRSKYWPKS